jgi:hypothetical protein
LEPKLSEAERRIEEARSTQAETLDLGDPALRDLPPSLGSLRQLKRLFLGNVMPNESGEPEEAYDRKSPELSDPTLFMVPPAMAT